MLETRTALLALSLLVGISCSAADPPGQSQRSNAGSENSGGSETSGGTGPGIDLPDAGHDCLDDNSCGGQGSGDGSCGDAMLDADLMEECDDGNAVGADGCGTDCRLEPGWICPFVGLGCEASQCGDGVVAGNEQCDFGAAMPAGCDPLTCSVQPGYACDAQSCHATTCGDTIVEGSEPCDDGNDEWNDGCTPDCRREPDCSGASCTSICGDGLLLPGSTSEPCDDGNTQDGDGCSAACMPEAGYMCVASSPASGGLVVLPIVYRDFKSSEIAGGHPNFQVEGGGGNDNGMVGPLGAPLGPDGKPAYSGAPVTNTLTNATDFSSWFNDDPTYNLTIRDAITLTETPAGSGIFVFEDTTFFPLDGRGWNDPAKDGHPHNFYFTSELHSWFQWSGNEVLTFFGDDDVWVYVNKKLAVDIGGIHGPIQESVTLDAATNTNLDLGMVLGEVYEIIVFQAERKVQGSQYKLTLEGFNVGISKCLSVCGDGVVTRDELCDEGSANNLGGYGQCAADCKTRGGYCGDGVLQVEGGEECDDGNNRFGDGCNSACFEEVVQ